MGVGITSGTGDKQRLQPAQQPFRVADIDLIAAELCLSAP